MAVDPARFGEQALKHSECPTAMNGGLLDTERPSRLEEARQTIREHLERHRRGACQKSWIKALRREARGA